MKVRALALIAVVGCAHPGERAAVLSPTNATTEAPRADAQGSRARAPAELEVTETTGLPPEQVHAIFEPAAEPLARCLPGQSGKINVRVQGATGALHVFLDPSVSLDERARECAASTLSQVYLEQTGSNAGGPDVPPSGFTSILTVSW